MNADAYLAITSCGATLEDGHCSMFMARAPATIANGRMVGDGPSQSGAAIARPLIKQLCPPRAIM